MKIFFIVSLLIILIGCTKKQVNMDESAVESEPQLVENHEFNLDNSGEFYRYNEMENIGTYETGPVIVHIEKVEILKGSLKEDYDKVYNIKADEEIDLLSFQIRFDANSTRDDYRFNQNHLHLVTDTGEKVEQPNELLSSVVDQSLFENTNGVLRQFAFRLEDSTAQEVEQATLLIDAPVDSEGTPIGEDLEIEIDFTKDN